MQPSSHSLTRCVADEEDAALSAFLAFQRGAQQGRFPNLTSGDEALCGSLTKGDVEAVHALAFLVKPKE